PPREDAELRAGLPEPGLQQLARPGQPDVADGADRPVGHLPRRLHGGAAQPDGVAQPVAGLAGLAGAAGHGPGAVDPRPGHRHPEKMQSYGQDFLNPDFSNWRALVSLMWLTVQIALWGTFLAVFMAVPLSLMASRNLSPAWLVWPVRRVMDLMRSIPDLVIATL